MCAFSIGGLSSGYFTPKLSLRSFHFEFFISNFSFQSFHCVPRTVVPDHAG